MKKIFGYLLVAGVVYFMYDEWKKEKNIKKVKLV